MGDASDAFELSIPVIDISGYYGGSEATKTAIANQLREACQAPGFFQIVGHKVPQNLRGELLGKLAAFFALPQETKQALHRGQSKCLRGYERVGEQMLEKGIADQKEGFMIGRERPLDSGFLQGPNQWPDESVAPGFHETMDTYFAQMLDLSKVMFRLMALSLRLEENYFDDFVASQESVTMCRAHRYPPTTPEVAARSRGIGAHTDFGALTLLLQDKVGGLQVFHKPSSTWHPVRPIENAFVVNIGDMMERWTNNKYTSTLHRVISPVTQNDRYSVAFFNEGLGKQTIECIPTCVAAGEKPLHKPIKAEDHLRQRYGQSY